MDEQDAMDRLDAYLDGLVRGEPPLPGDLGSDLASIAERVNRIDRRPAPEDARARVWQSLNDQAPRRGALFSPNGFAPARSVALPPPYQRSGRNTKPRPSFARCGRAFDNLAAAGLVVLALAAILLIASGGHPAWWNESGPTVALPRGGATNSGELDATGPSGPPVERWRFQLPAGTASYAAPVVTDSQIFVAPPGGTLVAVDPATGMEIWRFRGPSDTPVSGAPAVVDGVVYVGTLDGNLHALEAATGMERWHLDLGTPFTSPIVVGDTAYVSAGSSQGAYPAVGDGVVLFTGSCACDKLLAVDLTTASLKWTFVIPDVGLVAVDAVSGAERWQAPADDTGTAPAIDDGSAYLVTTDGWLVSLDLDDGHERWRAPLAPGQTSASAQVASPSASGDSVLVVQRDGTLIAWDAETGEERWRQSLAAAASPRRPSSPAASSMSATSTASSTRWTPRAETSVGPTRWTAG